MGEIMNNKFTIMFLTACIFTAQAEQQTIQTGGLPRIVVNNTTQEEIQANRNRTEQSYKRISSGTMRWDAMEMALNSILDTARSNPLFVNPETLNKARFDLGMIYQKGHTGIRDYEKAQSLYEQIINDSNAPLETVRKAQQQLEMLSGNNK